MLSAVSSSSSSALMTMQSLRSLNKQVSTVQIQIATGKRVNTAKDDAAIWSLANTLKTDLAMGKEVAKGLSIASSTVAAASAGAEAVVDLLQKMQAIVIEYQANDSTGTANYASAEAAVLEMVTQVTDIVTKTEFQGKSLLATASTDMTVMINEDGDTITVTKKDLQDAAATDLTTDATAATDYTTLLAAIDTALDLSKPIATYFGTASKRIDTQSDLLATLNDNLSASISNLIDTDMDEAAARLTALQTQQQLATQLLSITTQNQSALIQTLFRGF
ncbi:flagellin [Teichococcus aestuarii]|uniref:flagellin n=2 Tax=Teichococcus aestuarii TaxID=568898 RepID=UPI003621F2A2